VGWFNDQVRKLKNRNTRSATGAYEQPLQGASGGGAPQRRGFGPLDPDEAWDARVGPGADDTYGHYEERGQGGDSSEYHGAGGNSYSMNLAGPYGRDHDHDHDDEGERGRKPGRPDMERIRLMMTLRRV